MSWETTQKAVQDWLRGFVESLAPGIVVLLVGVMVAGVAILGATSLGLLFRVFRIAGGF